MTTFADLDGTSWTGQGELWLEGDTASQYDCSLDIRGKSLNYRWTHEDQSHVGTISLTPDGGEFVDTFHSKEKMTFKNVPDSLGHFQILGAYGDWHWRIALVTRPHNGELVLQMTNIAPWGEEGRAVRMVFSKEA